MTNTITNVPRELLEAALSHPKTPDEMLSKIKAAEELRALLSAPSPAGVDGLEVVGVLCISRFRNNPAMENVEFQLAADVAQGQHDLCRLSAAQAIIDGLRGEVDRLDRESQSLSNQLGSCGRDRILFRAERDQQAQRIGELDGLLDRVKVSLSLDDTEWGYSAPEKYKLLADIRAALSAGKEGE